MWICHRGSDGTRAHDADTRHRRQPLADLALPVPSGQVLGAIGPGASQPRARQVWSRPFMSHYLCQILDIAQTLGCDDPTAKPKVGHSAAAE